MRLQNVSGSATKLGALPEEAFAKCARPIPCTPAEVRAVPRTRDGGTGVVKPNYAPRRSSIAWSRQDDLAVNHLGQHLWNLERDTGFEPAT